MRKYILYFIFFVQISFANPTQSIHIIQLYNRPAESMIPLVRPFVEKTGGGVSGTGFKLILKTTEENYLHLKSIIERLDTPPIPILISVKQSSSGSRSGLSSRRLRQFSGNNEGETLQTIRTLDGSESYINVKHEMPVVKAYNQNARVMGSESVNTGFYVIPRVHGRSVTLVLSLQSGKFVAKNGANVTSQVTTQISTILGRWTKVAGIGQRGEGQAYGIIFAKRGSAKTSYNVYIKVDKLNQLH